MRVLERSEYSIHKFLSMFIQGSNEESRWVNSAEDDGM